MPGMRRFVYYRDTRAEAFAEKRMIKKLMESLGWLPYITAGKSKSYPGKHFVDVFYRVPNEPHDEMSAKDWWELCRDPLVSPPYADPRVLYEDESVGTQYLN